MRAGATFESAMPVCFGLGTAAEFEAEGLRKRPNAAISARFVSPNFWGDVQIDRSLEVSEFLNGFKRTHTCGELRGSDAGKTVRLVGWVQDYRNLGSFLFIVLRDRYGVTQIHVDASSALFEQASRIRAEWCIGVEGVVISRGKDANRKLATGEIEVEASSFRIFNRAETTPFAIHDKCDADEKIRLKYRYLDLRRPCLNHNIIVRSKVTGIIRRVLEANQFLDLETPILGKSTPEGARDYLVPSRVQPGAFYALPQSPQLFKQLYMVSGFDRYYQIARCFRDEDLRLDRQPEFTQIDMEMSFIEPEDIQNICEEMICTIFKEILGIELTRPFRRISWDESMDRYGVDAPDIRFGMELNDVTEIFRGTSFKLFAQALEHKQGTIRAICVPASVKMSRKDIEQGLTEVARTYGAKALAWTKMANGQLDAGIAKNLSEQEKNAVVAKLAPEEGDTLLFVADKLNIARNALGRVRKEIAVKNNWVPKQMTKPEDVGLTWVTDFPMFEWSDEDNRWYAMHHPFTSPRPQDWPAFDNGDFGNVYAQAYDLVLNGIELGGGSIRIHNIETQQKVFRALGIGDEEARQKFSFLLDALSFGAPPHGGLAFGLDRMVMLLTGADSLRDVIAFPKTNKAADMMTEAPSGVDDKQLRELCIRCEIPEQEGKA